jgi:hypothetical protein
MTDWITLSDRDHLDHQSPALMDHGLFVVEFQLPVLDPTILIQMQSDGPTPRTFSLFFDPEGGLSLLQRDGATVRRHLLPGPMVQRQGTARLAFAFDAGAGIWSMDYTILGDSHRQSATGRNPLALVTADLHGLSTSAPGALRHPAALWFGATQKSALPDRAPWIGLNTPIDTKRGPVRAGLLKPGDLIATLDDGFQPLHALRRRSFPSRGTFAPVVLRSPFFGLNTDILVSSDQLVLISGASVEYLYGVEEALISAASLCDGHVAAKDERRALTDAVALDMGAPFAITADGCCLMAAFGPGDALPRRALLDYEALPLLTLLGRTALRHVA